MASLILVTYAQAYPPILSFDDSTAFNILGEEVKLRHFEGREGWNNSKSNGAQLAVYINHSELLSVTRSTAIWIIILLVSTTWIFLKRIRKSKL